MKKIILILTFAMANFMASSQQEDLTPGGHNFRGKPREIVDVDGYRIPVYDFEGFKPFLKFTDDTTYVLNFWATWCKPCVEELPEFIRLADELANRKVSIIYVSLDFRKNLETGVIPFARARNMNKGVIMLNDPSANSWIGQVDRSWSGAIPATLIYRGVKREFHENKLSYEELKSIIESFINF